MAGIFTTGLFLSIIALIIGTIKPSVVIKWKQEVTRKDTIKSLSVQL